MSKLAKAFQNGKAFIPFITCGDPDLETTAAAVRAMAHPETAIDGDGITFYKGAPVIHLPFEWTAFSFGAIVLGSQYKSDSYGITMLNHEYGHVLQLEEYGVVSYTCTIAIPSVACNLLDRADLLPWTYYSSPWEYEADQLGGVTRTNYASWASDVSSGYSHFSKAVEVISIFLSLQK